MSVGEDSQRTGLVVSGAMHLTLLAALVFGFARAPRFDDAPESIPVETITTTQLNEIMEGEKTAKPAPTPPKPAPEKASPPPPLPPLPEPPPSPRPEPPKPEPPKPEPPKPEPPPPPPEPPRRPEPPKPEPPKPESPKPEPPKPVAEDAPSPPTRPRPAKPEETPHPPERPRVAKPEVKPPEKFKPDEIAKALTKDKPDEKPRPNPPAYDPSAISKLIGQTKTAEAAPNAAPAQGLQNHHAPRMAVSLENALNEWFRDSYKNCWNLPPSNPAGENYVFDVRVTFNPDGSLAGRPVMLNPPHDPEWRAHADSVMRAVARCNPLRIPPQYTPYFDQWRSKVVHFDPSSGQG